MTTIDFPIKLYSAESLKGKTSENPESNFIGYYIGGFKKYKGVFMPCGKGVCLFANGDFYEGYFKKGAPNGRGRMIIKGTRIELQSVS